MTMVAALLSHVSAAGTFVGGVFFIRQGWGANPGDFVLGCAYLCICAGFVWLTADAMRVTRRVRMP